jgi:acylphosphatase
MRRVRLTASGLVQGVFFRASTRDEARHLKVTGWVSNAPDGTVVAEVQGDPDAVEAMITFCRRGPGHARVERLDIADLPVADGEQGFGVR